MHGVTIRKAYWGILLSMAAVFWALASIAPSTPAFAAAALTINPTTGPMNTVTTITVTGSGFEPSASGYVWFDTNGDSIVDPTEHQVFVTVTETGDIPTGTTIDAPPLPPNKSYSVRADIPYGTPVEATAIFKTSTTTSELTVTKYDAYGAVVGSPMTVTYQWMESNLPVQGDGVTEYYLQGITSAEPGFIPSFSTIWDPSETVNLKDYGAAKGTDVKDLANLVGGAIPGDTVLIKASDGFSKWFDQETIYNPAPRQGKLVIAWYNATLGGYVPGYSTGMRLLWFADATTNPSGWHVFGNWDMHETAPEARWHYNAGKWPTSSGPSVQNVYNIGIYQPNLISTDAAGNPKESFFPGETVYVKGIGMAKNSSYNLWIQPEPVSNNKLTIIDGQDPIPPSAFVLNSANDPSGSQETVTTNGNGDFGPTAVWTVGSMPAVLNYDVVADSQSSGVVGKYDTYTAGNTSPKDFIDSPGFQGFGVTEAPTATPTPTATATSTATPTAAATLTPTFTPTRTSTPAPVATHTPVGVGGIILLGRNQSAPSARQPDSPAPDYVLLAGGVVAVLLALVAGGWYAKRRLS